MKRIEVDSWITWQMQARVRLTISPGYSIILTDVEASEVAKDIATALTQAKALLDEQKTEDGQ
jgi:hypothetical protein